jgi:hypothetical protein
MTLTVRDVVSPTAFFLFRTFGYALIAAAWILIAYFFWKAGQDVVQHFAGWRTSRRSAQIPLPFPVATSCRVIAFPANRGRKVTHA